MLFKNIHLRLQIRKRSLPLLARPCPLENCGFCAKFKLEFKNCSISYHHSRRHYVYEYTPMFHFCSNTASWCWSQSSIGRWRSTARRIVASWMRDGRSSRTSSGTAKSRKVPWQCGERVMESSGSYSFWVLPWSKCCARTTRRFWSTGHIISTSKTCFIHDS